MRLGARSPQGAQCGGLLCLGSVLNGLLGTNGLGGVLEGTVTGLGGAVGGIGGGLAGAVGKCQP